MLVVADLLESFVTMLKSVAVIVPIPFTMKVSFKTLCYCYLSKPNLQRNFLFDSFMALALELLGRT
jgi:hypothetical protein